MMIGRVSEMTIFLKRDHSFKQALLGHIRPIRNQQSMLAHGLTVLLGLRAPIHKK
jgi:hypothetical protein